MNNDITKRAVEAALTDEPTPIAVEFDPQEIGIMYAQHYTPEQFNHELLTKLKAAGVPVEGTLKLRLAHGQVYKVREEMAGRGKFVYMWLPEAYVHGISQRGGLHADGLVM